MPQLGEARVCAALATVVDPHSGRDIVAAGMISGLVIRDGNVGFAIEVDPKVGEAMEPVRQAAEDAVFALDGVSSVTAVLTAHRADGGAGPGQQQSQPQPQAERPALAPEVGAIVAIASGKGGVGKSTTAVNLALALAADGLAVGLLDADIYGPSIPRLLGITGRPESPDGKVLEPMRNHGIVCMSIGFLVAEDTPMIWRGPMVMSALEQMLRDVRWGALDVLIVDMPPGTGDAQLTMAQRVPLAGAVIVSTPQDLALLDARKGLNMFKKVDVPVFGIVENMSYFLCPACGHRSEIFGHGGARAEAARLGCDFLGEVRLDIAIRTSSDAGEPIVAAQPDSLYGQAYRAIAANVRDKLGGAARPAPRIVIQ